MLGILEEVPVIVEEVLEEVLLVLQEVLVILEEGRFSQPLMCWLRANYLTLHGTNQINLRIRYEVNVRYDCRPYTVQ